MRRTTWAIVGLGGLALLYAVFSNGPSTPTDGSDTRPTMTATSAAPRLRPSALPSPLAAPDADSTPEPDDPYAFTELRGRVLREGSTAGVEGARIRVLSAGTVLARTQSGPGGVFVIPGLQPGLYLFEAEAEGHLPTSLQLRKQAVLEDDEDIFIELGAAGVLEGRVIDPNGHPVHGAVVVLSTPKEPVSPSDVVRKTDPAGHYVFERAPLDDMQVTAHHPRFAPASSFLAARSSPRTQVDLRLLLGHTLSGRVLGSRGPIMGALVWLAPPGPDRGTSLEEARTYGTVTDAEGRYQLVAGQDPAQVVAWAEGHRSESAPVAGRMEIDLSLRANAPLRVRTLSGTGQPVTGVSVRVFDSEHGYCEGMTDEAGELLLLDLAGGEVRVELQTAEGLKRTERATLRTDLENVLTVAIEGRGRVTGHLVNRVSRERLTKMVLKLAREGDVLSQRSGSPSGSFIFEGVPEGTWTLLIQSPGFRPRELPGLPVGPGELELGAIELEPFARVEGRVEPPPGDILLVGETIDRGLDERKPFAISGEGRFEAWLNAGSYDVEVRDGEDRLLGSAHWSVRPGEVLRDVLIELREF